MAKVLFNLIAGKPVLAIFEVTLRCNSDCGYCDLPLNQGRYELTRTEIKRIFSDLHRDGVRVLFIQGGEPLLRRDLADILEDLAEIGFTLALVTNGTRFTPGLIARFAKLPMSISVSLDSLKRDTYRRIRGRNQLDKVLAGIELLADFPGPKHITCILSDKNLGDVRDVAAFAKARGFTPIIGAYHWQVRRYGKRDAGLIYERDRAVAVFKELLATDLIPAGYFRTYLKDNIRWLRDEKLDPCDAGRYSVAIDASGNVSPCLALGHRGNLRNQSLSAILAAMDRTEIKECSDNSTCNLLCSRIVGSSLRHPVNSLLTIWKPYRTVRQCAPSVLNNP